MLKYVPSPGLEITFVFIRGGPPWIYSTVEQLYIINANESIFDTTDDLSPMFSCSKGNELDIPLSSIFG